MSQSNSSTSDCSRHSPLLEGSTTKSNGLNSTSKGKREASLQPSNTISHYYVGHGYQNKFEPVVMPIPFQNTNITLLPPSMNGTTSKLGFTLPPQRSFDFAKPSLPSPSDLLNKSLANTAAVQQLHLSPPIVNSYHKGTPSPLPTGPTSSATGDIDNESNVSSASSLKENIQLPKVLASHPHTTMAPPLVPLPGIGYYAPSGPMLYPAYPMYPKLRQAIQPPSLILPQMSLLQAPPMHDPSYMTSSPKMMHPVHGNLALLLNPMPEQWPNSQAPPVPSSMVQYDFIPPMIQQKMQSPEQHKQQQECDSAYGVGKLVALEPVSSTKARYKLWTEEEDRLLVDCKRNQLLSWKAIATRFPTRTMHACQFRWRKINMMHEYQDVKCEVEFGCVEEAKREQRFESESIKSEEKMALSGNGVKVEVTSDRKRLSNDGDTCQNSFKEEGIIKPQAKRPKTAIAEN